MDFLEQGLAAFVVVGSLVHDTVKGGHKLGAIGSNIRRHTLGLVLSKNTEEVLESGDRLIDVVLAIIPCFIPAVLRGNLDLQGLQLLVGLGQPRSSSKALSPWQSSRSAAGPDPCLN